MKKTTKAKTDNGKTKKTITKLLPILTLMVILCSANLIVTVKAAPTSIFEDGFESNNFNAWDQTQNNSGGSIRTVSDSKYSGNYASEFTSNNYNWYETVHATKAISANSELYARAYVNVDINGINNSQDKFYFIKFSANYDNVLFAGWKLSGTNIQWQLLIRDGSGYTSKLSTSIANTKEWYCIEVYWQKDRYNGEATLWINGNQEINIDNKNTNNFGDVTKVHFGVAEAYQISYSKIYGDNFVISDEYIGPIQTNDDTTTDTSVTYSNLISDDFESRTLNKWTGTETTSRETVTIHSYRPYEGRYHARFSSSGSSGTENAYLYQKTNLENAYADGYFYVISGFPLSNQNARFNLISFLADEESVAGIGIRMDNGEMKWTAYAKDRSTTVFPTFKENPTIRDDQWYKVELYWQKDSNQGKVEVQINGEKIFEITSINTNYYGNVDTIQMGIIDEISIPERMLVYGDNFEITTQTIPNNDNEPTNQEPTTNPTPQPEPAPEPEPEQTTPSNPSNPTPSPTSGVYKGLSGYPTSTSQIDQIIRLMDENNLNIYRMSFNPEWFSGKPHPYRANYIQYFLDHSDYTIVVDRNHIYPPTEAGAQEARNNWQTVKNSLYEILNTWPNNPRVMVELINEYVSSDFYPRMQDLVTEIRSNGYTNPIVVNKWNQPWTKINDPLDNTYQGYHFYFNSWSVSGATSQMNIALSRGIKIISTEVGADYNEHNSFTSGTVGELNQFLAWCKDHGIGNTVWMNENLNNWQTYQQLGLNFP